MIFLQLKMHKNKLEKEDKKKISRGISENAKETVYSYFYQFFKFKKNSNISKLLPQLFKNDFVYDTNFSPDI